MLCLFRQFAGDPEAQVSEIHPRAVNGNGAFNWRFLFNFGYAFLDRKRNIPGEVGDLISMIDEFNLGLGILSEGTLNVY